MSDEALYNECFISTTELQITLLQKSATSRKMLQTWCREMKFISFLKSRHTYHVTTLEMYITLNLQKEVGTKA